MRTLAELEALAYAPKSVPVEGDLAVDLAPPTKAAGDAVRALMAGDVKAMGMDAILGVARAAIRATLSVDGGEPGEDLAEALLARSGGLESELSVTALSLCGLSPVKRADSGNVTAPRGGSSPRQPKKRG